MLYDEVVWYGEKGGIGAEYSIKMLKEENQWGRGLMVVNDGWRNVGVLNEILVKRGFVLCTMQRGTEQTRGGK